MNTAREPLIEFKGVSKTFGTRNILNKINFSIYEGEVTTLIGLSGTGKSVTLKHIIGMLKPDEGQILYRGKPIDQMTKKEWDDYISQISYMFQNNALFDSMTVYENVAMPLKYATKLSKQEIDKKVMARIDQTELTEVADKYPSEISGGMQKRVALARALVTDPSIVLFDEPTTGQDPIRKNAILSMVAEYQKRLKFTALLISHEIPDVYYISNRILALYNREIAFQGDPEKFAALDHPFRRELITSLVAFGEELSESYSKRQFKVRYQTDLSRSQTDATYALAFFTVDKKEIEALDEHLGTSETEKIIRSLISYINKHFGTVGGYSTRLTRGEYQMVLPNSNLDEANRIMENFTKDIREQGIKEIELYRGKETCVEFSLQAGVTMGKPEIEIETVAEFAKLGLEEISRFKC